ncbi:F-box family protein [Trifolium pratense]|uniref:F-box family protein n=1 Tax=Trifolium pratense TaxID=57577 RepID=A0A2K3M362_TRIPR|nr:F-box family protein [Trifolium pratense]
MHILFRYLNLPCFEILSLDPDLFKVKLPSLRNLKSLKVELKPRPLGLSSYVRKEVVFKYKSRKEAHKILLKEADEPFVIIPKGVVNFLLQNSPSAEVDIIDYRGPQ